MPARTSTAIPALRRNLIVAGGVVLLHLGALWALQSGLLQHPAELFVPVKIVTEIITPPVARPAHPPAKPEPPPPPPKPPRAAEPPKPTRATEPPRHVPPHKALPPPAPNLVAAPELPPAPSAPTGVPEPQPAPPPVTAAVAVAPAPAPTPAVANARIDLPISDADYLHNPKPAYPPTSRRLGEQGKVVLRVLIGVDGRAQDASVLASSGYDRLDRAALEAARQWRYVPGKRGGVPEPMWVKVPIAFDLSE